MFRSALISLWAHVAYHILIILFQSIYIYNLLLVSIMHHISPIWAEMQAKSVLERTCPLPSRDWNEKVNRVLEGLFEANDGLKLEDRAYKSKIYLNTFAGMQQ